MGKSGKLSAHNMYARYSGILSMSNIALLLIDTNGDILLEFNPSPDFCRHVCQKDRQKLCQDYCDRFQSKQEEQFTCRYGLVNILLPIVLGEDVMGYIAGIQSYAPETEFKKYLIDTKGLAAETGLESEFVAKAIAALKTVDQQKVSVHEQLCRHISKNVAQDLLESTSDEYYDEYKTLTRLSIEKELLEKKIIDLEAKNMSLVINPHFLFNTLNSIARIAYFEHSHTTEELIYCLSDLLRYNLKQEDQLHTVESEIDNIEKYLYIQKIRFKNRLEYNIDVPDSIKPCRIPNMVLQPIVENALIHGITPKRDGGIIKISAEKYQNQITILVMDNGNGFPKKVLSSIQDKTEGDGQTGLGFQSTDKRLKRYYGERYGLQILKSDFGGSTVAIIIPTQPIHK